MNTKPTTNHLRRTLLLAACAIACAAPLAPASALSFWGFEQVEGSGNVTRQAREVGHFSGVSMALPGSVELRMGNTEGVTVETDDNLQPLVETVVEGGTLMIRPARRNLNLRVRHLKVIVQARAIEHLALAGSGNIDADSLRAPRLKLDVGGSGAIRIANLDSDALNAHVAGSGDLSVGGSARSLALSIAGSGDAELGHLKSANANVQVAGSGDATVWATATLSVSIAGSGDIGYYGDPAVNRSVLGSGEVRRLGASPR